MTPSLYQRLLGDRFAQLPVSLQHLHSPGERVYSGFCTIQRGKNPLACLLANLLSLPKTTDHCPVTVRFYTRNDREYWDRDFNGHRFLSIQWQKGDLLYERLNLTTLVYQIATTDHSLDLVLQRVFFMSLPMMRLFSPRVVARETDNNGRFHFFIQTAVPLLGLLVQYEGDLESVAAEPLKS